MPGPIQRGRAFVERILSDGVETVNTGEVDSGKYLKDGEPLDTGTDFATESGYISSIRGQESEDIALSNEYDPDAFIPSVSFGDVDNEDDISEGDTVRISGAAVTELNISDGKVTGFEIDNTEGSSGSRTNDIHWYVMGVVEE